MDLRPGIGRLKSFQRLRTAFDKPSQSDYRNRFGSALGFEDLEARTTGPAGDASGERDICHEGLSIAAKPGCSASGRPAKCASRASRHVIPSYLYDPSDSTRVMTRSLLVATVALVAFIRLFGYFTEPRLSAGELHRVDGEPARLGAAAAPASLTVVTWNIERGMRFERVAEALRRFNADVVLLQEVDRFCRRSGLRDVARDLAYELNYNFVSGAEFQEIGQGRGDVPAVTGQAILSRTPIEDAAVIVFPDQARMKWRLNPFQPRRGGRIALRARTAGLVVYSLHLESGRSDELRFKQLAAVFADAASVTQPTIVAGDFNNSETMRPAMVKQFAAAGFADVLKRLPSKLRAQKSRRG